MEFSDIPPLDWADSSGFEAPIWQLVSFWMRFSIS